MAWQVIQYNDAVVQRGTTSLRREMRRETATVSSVDTSKSWLVYGYTTADGSGTNIGQKLVRGLVTERNDTHIRSFFDRPDHGRGVGARRVHRHHRGPARQRRVLVHRHQPRMSRITAVDPARSIAVGGYDLFGGRTSRTPPTTTPGSGGSPPSSTTSTNLRIQRDAALATADLGWFVVHWPGTTAPLVVNSTGDAG